MSLSKLVSFIDKKNIAEDLDGDILDEIGQRVKRQFDEDFQSMQDWIETVEKGIKLMKQEFTTKSIPWEGASNFKSPLLSEASISFGDKAVLELLRPRNLVKADIIGKDPNGIKKARSERLTEVMNYQLNYQMREWRHDQERLVYTVSNVGALFKKTVFNPIEQKNESHIIQYPDFVVNQATTNLRNARSFTQILTFDKNEVVTRQKSKLWLDVDIYPIDSEGDAGSKEAEGVLSSAKNDDRFFEQHCFADLNNDGIDEPYIVTLHEASNKIVRIVARFDEGSFIVRTRDGRVLPLRKAIIDNVKALAQRGIAPPEEPDLSAFELVRIEPLNQLTKYGFLPAPDGTFLDLGYAHLLGAITQGINTTTNQLFDAGKLRNVGGGLMAKNVRKKMGPLKMRIGEWISTELSPDNLKNGFFPNPQPEPSATLFQLLEKLEQQGRNFAAIVDTSGAIQANTAPTTALAIIQESLIPTSALIARILKAESHEFEILFRLNQRFFDPELYKKILDDPQASAFADFNSEDIDIVPTASPEKSSKLQRIQLASVELEQFDRVVQVGGNAKQMLINYFEAIGTENVEQIFPDPSSMTPEEKQQIESLQKQQQLLAQQQQQQIELTRAQVDLARGELERLNFRTQAEVQKLLTEIEKIESETILTLEKAETEEIKNAIDTYTASIKALNESAQRVRNILEVDTVNATNSANNTPMVQPGTNLLQ